MGVCDSSRFLRLIPTSDWRLVWSWRAENGSDVEITGRLSSKSDCIVELANLSIGFIVLVLMTVIIFKYKCRRERPSSILLSLHTTRSVLCTSLILFLILELSESMMSGGAISQVVSLLGAIACWIVHRESEKNDGLGLAATAGAFATIAFARVARLFNLHRFELTMIHVRFASTAGTALVCAFLAIIDSCVFYKMMRKPRAFDIRGREYGSRVSYRHEQASFIDKLTFNWVTDLLRRGFRSPLSLTDLGQLPEEESSLVQFQKFRKIYEERKNRNGGKTGLWPCYWRRVWSSFAIGGFVKLLGDAASLVGPMAISRIVHHVSSRQNSTKTDVTNHVIRFEGFVTFDRLLDNGYFVGLVMFLAAILQSTLSQASTHQLNVEGIRLRTALQALIYDKSLRLCSWTIAEEDESANKNLREKNTHRIWRVSDIGTLTNLMAEDVCNIMSFFWIGHYTWAIPLKIAAIIFLLYLKVGVSALIGAICCIIVMTPMQLYLGKKMSSNSKKVAEKSDSRLRLLNEILQGIRLVKLRAWEKLFNDRVKKTRSEELWALNVDSIYWALITFLTQASSVVTTLLTFVVYIWLEEAQLDAATVFSTLALFSQLSVPLFVFPVIVPIIISAATSTKRLEDFLSLPETGLEELDKTIPVIYNSERRVSQTVFGTLGKIRETFDEDENVNVSIEGENLYSSETILLSVEGIFSWGRDENLLNLRRVEIPRGKLTLIVGPTGSGKTCLVSAILGEMQRLEGRLFWSREVSAAYVSQKPWLLNATLRENILFGSNYRPRRYRNVLRACALEQDVDILPGNDLTRIGQKGINLSGGQKQRIAIARAIYSDAEAVILDDPLSALDQQVGRWIFENGIRGLLLREGRSVIMVTHKLEFLHVADHIVAMDSLKIRASGTKDWIERIDPALATDWRESLRKGDARADVRKTAKDRWSLLRLVSRIGASLGHRNPEDGSWSTDKDAYVVPPNFLPLRLRRSTLSESRYLAHDLTDLPIPAEEWALQRRCERKHKAASRSSSLQPPKNPPPVMRQSSTPTILEAPFAMDYRRNKRPLCESHQNSMVKLLFSGRTTNAKTEEARMNRERSILSRLMSTPNDNNKDTKTELEDRTLKRLMSTESTTSEIDESSQEAEFREIKNSIQAETRCGEVSVTKNVWIDYWRAGGFAASFGYFAAAAACQALRIYTDLWLSRWTDSGIRAEEWRDNREEAIWYFRMYVGLSVGSVILAALSSAAGQWTGARAREKLHEEAISGLLGVSPSFFETTPIGTILNRFSADMGVVDKKLATALQRLTCFVLLCSSAILVNIIVSPWFLAAAIPMCFLYYFLQRFYRRSARELQRLEGSTRGPVAAHFAESLAGLSTIRVSKQQHRFAKEMMEHLDAHTNAFLILNTSSRWLGIALDYVGAIILIAATYAALFTAESRPDRLTPALVGLAVNYTLLVPIYLNWVVKFISEIEMYMGSVARLGSYANISREDVATNGTPVSEDWPEKGEIVFEDVSLQYDSRDEPIVHNLDLRIPAGQKLGICGRTSSGKSSTVMALFRLVRISKGRILVDGVDIAHVPLDTLRSRLSAIPQEIVMFSGSIRENLDPLSEHTEAEIWRALELAQMKDTIAANSQGLELQVREGGENFSVGQLQLLSMARAVLRRSSIVVFDEATSALDLPTEKKLVAAITSAFKDKTVITVAHRVASLMECDRVVVFDEGRIVERGSPRELAQRPMGIFTAMLRAGDASSDEF